MVLDRHQHVMQAVLVLPGVVDVVGCDDTDAELAGDGDQGLVPFEVFEDQVVLQLDVVVPCSKHLPVAFSCLPGSRQVSIRHPGCDLTASTAGQGEQPFRVLGQPAELHAGFASR